MHNLDVVYLEFFKSNVRLLLKKEVTKKEIKEKFDEHLLRNNLKCDFLEEKLAETYVSIYIKSGLFSNKNELDDFLTGNEFLRRNIHSNEKDSLEELLNEALNFPKKFTPTEAINQANLIIADIKSEILTKKSLAQKMALQEETLNEKRRIAEEEIIELEKKSELLQVPDDPIPENEEPSEFELWWEKIGLVSDPFITTNGLERVPIELYDSILVKTTLFQKYFRLLEVDPQSLVIKTRMIFGDFGSGKTTLFDTIANKCITKGILPLRIILRPEQTEFNLQYYFDSNLLDDIKKSIAKEIGGNITDSFIDSHLFNDIKRGLSLLSKNHKGFIIVIDGLNHSPYTDALLKFLRNLQPFKENLRVGSNLNVGLIIAGAKEWYTQIVSDESLSGPIEIKELMPEITPENVCEMINLRFSAYSKNKESYKKIKPGFINQIFRDMKNRNTIISYRTFIQRLCSELETGNTEILDVEIDEKTKEEIRSILEENEVLISKFNKLFASEGFVYKQLKIELLNLISRVYNEKIVLEGSELFTQYKKHLKKLQKVELIVGAEKGGQFGWAVCSELQEVNRKVFLKFNRSLDDYLVPVFIGVAKKKAKSRENDTITKIKKDLAVLNEEITDQISKEALSRAFNYFEKICEFEEDIPTNIDDSILTNAQASFRELSVVLFKTEKIFKEQLISSTPIEDLWKAHSWAIPESVSTYIINSKSGLSSTQDKVTNLFFYKNAFMDVLPKISHIRKLQTELDVQLDYLTTNEISLYNKLAEKWLNKDDINRHYSVMKEISDEVQSKLREFLYNIFTLLHGEYCENAELWLKRLDPNTSGYITKNLSTITFCEQNANIFTQLNRGNYKNFLTAENQESSRNWSKLFELVLTGWSKESLKKFLSIFAEVLKESEHAKGSFPDQKVIKDFVLDSFSFFRNINKAYLNLMKNGLYYVKPEMVQGAFYFSVLGYDYDNNGNAKIQYGLKDQQDLVPIPINKEMISNLNFIMKQEIEKSGYIEIDPIESYKKFNIRFRDFFFSIAYLLQYKKFVGIKPPNTKYYSKFERAPYIYLAIHED